MTHRIESLALHHAANIDAGYKCHFNCIIRNKLVYEEKRRQMISLTKLKIYKDI